MTGTHYDVPDGHQYYSAVDEPEHFDPGDVDSQGRCAHQDDAKTCAHGSGKQTTPSTAGISVSRVWTRFEELRAELRAKINAL